MENLFKNKKLFYLKSEEEKINYDGTYKIVEDYRNRIRFIERKDTIWKNLLYMINH